MIFLFATLVLLVDLSAAFDAHGTQKINTCYACAAVCNTFL